MSALFRRPIKNEFKALVTFSKKIFILTFIGLINYQLLRTMLAQNFVVAKVVGCLSCLDNHFSDWHSKDICTCDNYSKIERYKVIIYTWACLSKAARFSVKRSCQLLRFTLNSCGFSEILLSCCGPYGCARFEQGFLYYAIRPAFVKWHANSINSQHVRIAIPAYIL